MGSAIDAARTTAIGMFYRRSDTPLSKEITLRFPILLNKAFTKAQKGRVMYPNEFNKLREERKLENRVKYTTAEYDQIQKLIGGGNLVTAEIYEYQQVQKKEPGAEAPPQDAPDKKFVFLRLHHYDSATRNMVSFSMYSSPETAVVDMVRYLMPLEEGRYLSRPIPAESKLAIIAPLEGTSLNSFYEYLMQLKFDVRVLTGSDNSPVLLQEMEPLRSLDSTRLSYVTVKDTTAFSPPSYSAAADNDADRAEYEEFAALEARMVGGFDRELAASLAAIRNRTKADYLLILKPDGKKSFARGFDLSQGNMIWFQDSFPATSGAAGDVLAAMITEMQRPTVTIPEEQFEAMAQEKDKMSSQGASGGLASVAILDFYDRTNTVLYTWLSSSLSAAVDDSMKKIFEYDRAAEAKSTEAGSRLFKTPADITPDRLKEFQKATGADYLIFGFYSLNSATGNISIESKVYDLVKNKLIGGSTTQSPVDVRLFNTVDEISQGIVQDIFNMTQGQSN
ncbi:MAG: hypothetical protein KF713_04055 [Turneriella sp.]|nr:hypothetical protein [Turneriella sp.]